MKKYYTLAEYCRHFEVDCLTRRKMNKLRLIQQRTAGEKAFTRGSIRPLEFWRDLHTKAESTSSIPAMFFSVPGYLRKTHFMEGVDPGAFYAFMKARYRAYKSRARHGYAYDDLVFLFADLQAGGKQFLNKSERHSAPEPNTCTVSDNTTQGSIYVTVPERGPGMSLLDWLLVLLLVGDVVAVACVMCCF